jgi:hypothetical protein
LTFFLDNNLSPILAEGLRAFGEDVRHLREIFPPDTPDEVWLPEIGQRGWYLVTYPGVVGPAGEGIPLAGSVAETWPDTAGISLGKPDCRVPAELSSS